MISLAKILINKTLEELDNLITDSDQKQLISDLRLLLADDIEAVFLSLKERLSEISLKYNKLKKNNNEEKQQVWGEEKTILLVKSEEEQEKDTLLFENITA